MGIAVYYLLAVPETVAFREVAIIICMVAIIASLLTTPGPAPRGSASIARSAWCSGPSGSWDWESPPWLFGAGREGLLLFWIVAILALASVFTVIQRFVYVYQVTEGARARRAERTLSVATGTPRPIAPAKGKLGVLTVGLGAVAMPSSRCRADPPGQGEADRLPHQMGTIRLGKRTEGRAP
ncbi:MAG: hypothetical protein U0133_01295 [Gemmatimonadales bacterium]